MDEIDKKNKKISWSTNNKIQWITPKTQVLGGLHRIFMVIILFLGFLVLFAVMWARKHFGNVTLEMMVMQLRMPLKGTGGNYFVKFFVQVLLPTLVCTIAIMLIGRFVRKKEKSLFIGSRAIFPNRITSILLAILFLVVTFGQASVTYRLPQYIANTNQKSDFIETNYQDPVQENLVFPKQKRNLIYIYMESIESTFLSNEQGGQMNENIMPELFDIAQNHVSFSDKEKIGGAVPLPGTGVTSAGIVAQTAGVPLLLPDSWMGEEAREVFISDAATLGDILEENGYAQYFMVGSDAEFGARDKYYKAHGNAVVFDLFTARESGVVPANYDNRFWGMEDKYLYEYAKQELNQIAQKEQPFCFTMLTVDTHFPDGYFCSLCKNDFDDPYSNVLACASRQLGSFLEWLQQQDYYENTTVIIIGDHLSMNIDYFTRNNLDVAQRRIYNVFINTADTIPVQEQNRMFSALDFFPTTLAALGVEIKGDRLGLGTNLFSEKSTLLEMYGYDYMYNELLKNSEYYNRTFHSAK